MMRDLVLVVVIVGEIGDGLTAQEFWGGGGFESTVCNMQWKS